MSDAAPLQPYVCVFTSHAAASTSKVGLNEEQPASKTDPNHFGWIYNSFWSRCTLGSNVHSHAHAHTHAHTHTHISLNQAY